MNFAFLKSAFKLAMSPPARSPVVAQARRKVRSNPGQPRLMGKGTGIVVAVVLALLALVGPVRDAAAYTYSKSITVDRTKVGNAGAPTTLSNYPMLYSVIDANLATTANGGHVTSASGFDIIFQDSSGNKLDHEIEQYNATTGQFIAWVRIPTLNTQTNSSNTVIYISYGDSTVTTSQENKTGVWDANFKGVWHLPNGTTLTASDSTSNANNGTLQNTPTAVAGQIDGGGSFASASSQYISTTNSFNNPQDLTVSAWFKTSTASGTKIIGLEDAQTGTGGANYDRMIYMGTDGKIYFGWYSTVVNTVASTSTLNNGQWHHAVGTHTSGNVGALYIDGVLQGTGSNAAQSYTGYWRIGSYKSGGWVNSNDGYFTGQIDEARVSNVARTADWVKTEYNNQKTPGNIGSPGFYTVSAELAACAYSFRKSITVNSGQVVGGPLTNYPMLVSFTDPNIANTLSGGNVTDPGGDDIIFRASDGVTQLNHEIETYVSTTGQLVAWVGVPSINTGTVIYMYYGNSCVTSPTQNPTGVWDSNFKGVWHLQQSGNGTAGEFKDSTSNANNGQGGGGTLANTPAQATGEIGYGQQFTGGSGGACPCDYIQIADTASLDETTQLTMEAWVKLPTPTTNQKIMGKTDQNITRGYLLASQTGGLYAEIWDSAGTDHTFTSGGTLSTNTWTHLAVTWTTSGSMIGYINGVQVNSISAGSNNIGTGGTTPQMRIGSSPWNGPSWPLSGVVDEARISNLARSANWLKTEVNNQSAPGSFSAVGAQQSLTAALGGFNAYESSTAAGAITGVIKTKIAGASVSLDIIALNGAKNAIYTTFTGTVGVDVLGNNTLGVSLDSNGCPTSYTLVQTLSPNPTFASGDNGRKTISFTVPNSYRDVRLRIYNPTPLGSATAIGCSNDNFAIRPNTLGNFAVTDTDWQTTGTPGARALNLLDFTTTTPVHKAGQPFSVRATALNLDGVTTTTNYTGAPTATLTACVGAACTSTFGTLTLSTTFAAGLLASDVASYSDVGSFALQLQDQTFASVDAADTSGDCTATGRYVCTPTLSVGRFVPDHFVVSYNTPAFATACGSFTYVGQPFNYTTAPVLTVTAQNQANNTTALYVTSGSWWRITNSSLTKSYSAATGTVNTSGLPGTDPVIVQTGPGVGTLTFSSGSGLSMTRGTPVAPFNADIALGVNVIDADGVAYASNPASFGTATAGNGIQFNTSKLMYFGQLTIGNALGSGLLNLPIQIQTQYWNGTIFVTNISDSCTTITAGNISLGNYQGSLNSGNLPSGNISISGAFNQGVGNLTLNKPSSAVNGTVDLTVGLAAGGMSYLQGAWAGTTYIYNPVARAAFGFSTGTYKSGTGSDSFVYQRENY